MAKIRCRWIQIGYLHLRGVEFNKSLLDVIIDSVFLIQPFPIPIPDASHLIFVPTDHYGHMEKSNVPVSNDGCIQS